MSRQAPPVQLQGSIDKAWQRLGRSACVLAVLGTSAWWLLMWQQEAASLAGLAAVPLAALACAVPVWRLSTPPPWQLRWDGQRWHWHGASQSSTCSVRPVLDLQRWLLLRVVLADTPLRPRWVALSRTQHRATWHALRCALYCPRPSAHALPLPEEERLVGKA